MPQMTVQSFTVMKDKDGDTKKDKFGNTQMMIKFQESPETAYKAVKDPSSITEGKIMYGTVQEGQYGFRFVADPYNDGQPSSTPYSAPQPAQQALGSNELLELVKDNNRMLKLLVGENEVTNEELPEPDFGG